MSCVKNVMKFAVIIAIIGSLFGCGKEEIKIIEEEKNVEETETVQKDSEKRTIYANVFDFDNYDGQPYFAVAFLGYGDIMEKRHTYVEGIFEELGDFAIEQVGHISYEGDEWYLVVPRYQNDVEIKNLDTNEIHTIHNGEAFTIKCNLSDLHSNIEISTEDGLSGHIFSPQIGGDGKLVPNPDVWDITDYSVANDNLYVQDEK